MNIQRKIFANRYSQDHVNLQYFTSINIGHPPQLFRAAIDISFSDLFVFSSQCQTEVCEGRYKYNSSWSTAYKKNGTEAMFKDSCFRGYSFISQDTLHLATLEIRDQLCYELLGLQRIWTCPYTPYFDAVLGLGSGSEQSLANIPNPFQSMVAQGLLDSNIIAFSLSSSSVGWSLPGEITCAGINHDQYVGELKYIPLSNVTDPSRRPPDPLVTGPPLLHSTWKAEGRALFWGNSTDEYYDLSGFTVRFDPAQFFIYLPWVAYKQLYDIIPIEPVLPGPPEINTVVCDRRETLPDLVFQLEDYNFTISAYQYTLEMTLGDYGRRCILGIMPSLFDEPDDKDVIVLGSVFLRGFYSVFDQDQKRIGREWPVILLRSV